jgi:hypothetical protein
LNNGIDDKTDQWLNSFYENVESRKDASADVDDAHISLVNNTLETLVGGAGLWIGVATAPTG